MADTKAPASCTRALSWALASVVPAIAVSAHVRGASVVAKAAGAAVHRCQPRPACLLATAHRQRPGGAVPQRWWWCWHDGALRCPHLRRQGSTAQTGYGVLQGSAGRVTTRVDPRRSPDRARPETGGATNACANLAPGDTPEGTGAGPPSGAHDPRGGTIECDALEVHPEWLGHARSGLLECLVDRERVGRAESTLTAHPRLYAEREPPGAHARTCDKLTGERPLRCPAFPPLPPPTDCEGRPHPTPPGTTWRRMTECNVWRWQLQRWAPSIVTQ